MNKTERIHLMKTKDKPCGGKVARTALLLWCESCDKPVEMTETMVRDVQPQAAVQKGVKLYE